ncbi:MAG: T9SS type A sorting domain-containing protein [Syntrophothermus sp.]
MNKFFTFFFLVFLTVFGFGQSVTPVPNNSFENWNTFPGYEDPVDWDTPNQELSSIPFFGTTVVTKSSDHQGAGSYSVKLESKHITLPAMDVPGFITCGKLTVDITNLTYTITGGAPVYDQPTHLKGYYKYIPKGGDSCVVAIGLFKTNNGVRDTIAGGYFSTKDTITDWTPFSAWIDYDTIVQPDSMNIIALSTAQELVITAGTALYLDNLYLDYTVGFNEKDPRAGVDIYNDRETDRLMVFFDFPDEQDVSLHLFNMTGQQVRYMPAEKIRHDRRVIGYDNLPKGVYILEVLHSGKKYTKKFFLN